VTWPPGPPPTPSWSRWIWPGSWTARRGCRPACGPCCWGRRRPRRPCCGGRGDLVGAPLPGVSVRLDDDGQLHAAGPNLAAGYLGRPPAQPPEQATGDLALIDGDGRIVLLGRAKDMLIRGRFNLYPGLYEPAVANLPGVAEAAFVGLPDEATGDEQVVLALVPAPGTDPAALPGLVRERLPGLIDAAALPDRVVTVAGLPTAGRSAKLDRAALATSLRPDAEGRA
jgi:acyl-CoA synthetase (AMP-forming)/AMP-acid ligase II